MQTLIKNLCIIFLFSQFVFSQQNKPSVADSFVNIAGTQAETETTNDKFGLYTAKEWQYKIDSTWGNGLPTENKLKIFDDYWSLIDEEYPSFHYISVNWDSLRSVFRPEIEAGVSRGRLYAIISQLFFSLRDFHTRMVDIEIARSELNYGTPILVPWGYWNVGHFGAALAPTQDSNLFVYKVADNHPLNLKIGDIVLGYDGIKWKDHYQKMYEIQFPLAASMNLPFKKAVWGTTPSAFKHTWLCSAGMNWHLFETIDIIKHSTKDTVHLPTKLLENKNMELIATGQMPIEGVPMPDIYNGHSISYGIIQNTNIGYIYNYGWHPGIWQNPGDEFGKAILDLKTNYDISGLIIDARICDGGSDREFQKIFPLLFDEDWSNLLDFVRFDPNNHFRLSFVPNEGLSYQGGDELFDHPIAVLTGPVAQSMGDIAPLIFKSHPNARLFGLPTNGAFGYSSQNFSKSYNGELWEEWITLSNMKMKNSSEGYLTHKGFSIDDSVWLKLEDVVRGHDTVVDSAITWINSEIYDSTTGITEKFTIPSKFTLAQNYPNPFNPCTIIKYTIRSSVMLNSFQHLNSSKIPKQSLPVGRQVRDDNTNVSLKVYDILGREVATLVNKKQKPGNYEITWDANNQPSGVYFFQLKTDNYVETKKMVLLR